MGERDKIAAAGVGGILLGFLLTFILTGVVDNLAEQDRLIERQIAEDHEWSRAQSVCAIANSVRAGPTPEGWMDQCMFRVLHRGRLERRDER